MSNCSPPNRNFPLAEDPDGGERFKWRPVTPNSLCVRSEISS